MTCSSLHTHGYQYAAIAKYMGGVAVCSRFSLEYVGGRNLLEDAEEVAPASPEMLFCEGNQSPHTVWNPRKQNL